MALVSKRHTSMSENNAITEGAVSDKGITATKKKLLSFEEKMLLLVVIAVQMFVIWSSGTQAGWYIESEQLQDE